MLQDPALDDIFCTVHEDGKQEVEDWDVHIKFFLIFVMDDAAQNTADTEGDEDYSDFTVVETVKLGEYGSDRPRIRVSKATWEGWGCRTR